MFMSANNTRDEFIQENINFERTVSRVSSRFVMLTNDFSSAIQCSLEDLGRARGASRAYIFTFKNDLELMDNTYEWCAEGVVAEIDNLKDLPSNIFPWWMTKLTQNEIILIAKTSNLPPEAAAEKEILESQGIQSLIVLPIYVNSALYGFIGFDNVEQDNVWDTCDITLLRLAAEIFGNAFHRLQSETQLRETNQQLINHIEEIKRLQSQLINQEKMVGIGQLAAGIAHEINNPLGFVTSNYEVLYRYIKHLKELLIPARTILNEPTLTVQPPHCQDAVNEIKQLWATYKIDGVIDDITELLDDSKIGFERVSEIISSLRNFAHTDIVDVMDYENVHKIINEVLLILNNEIKYVAAVDRHYGNLPQLYCHRGQIGQVFINLLINAVQAIKAAKTHELGHLCIRTWVDHERSRICIELSDDGIGIPPDVLPSIFNPFFTTKAIGEGTGLGLSISYDIIVNKHGGAIKVSSDVGKGTQFIIELPNI